VKRVGKRLAEFDPTLCAPRPLPRKLVLRPDMYQTHLLCLQVPQCSNFVYYIICIFERMSYIYIGISKFMPIYMREIGVTNDPCMMLTTSTVEVSLSRFQGLLHGAPGWCQTDEEVISVCKSQLVLLRYTVEENPPAPFHQSGKDSVQLLPPPSWKRVTSVRDTDMTTSSPMQ